MNERNNLKENIKNNILKLQTIWVRVIMFEERF